MNKILVNVLFPAVCMSYDMYLPGDAEISQITEMIKSACVGLTNGMFRPSEDSVLCDRSTGNILDVYSTPNELCLINGSELMFI